jgi:hypothetical protein
MALLKLRLVTTAVVRGCLGQSSTTGQLVTCPESRLLLMLSRGGNSHLGDSAELQMFSSNQGRYCVSAQSINSKSTEMVV